jgi:hypothetical protein
MILEGAYQLPGRAAREAARLLVNESGEGVTLQRQDEQRYIPLADITVSAALGNIPLTLTFKDGARFVPDDDAAFRRWFYQRRSPGWVHRLERHKRGVALALLMTLSRSWLTCMWYCRGRAARSPCVSPRRWNRRWANIRRRS